MKKLLFLGAIALVMSSCTIHRATVVSTSVPAPMKTITTVASVDVEKNRISYTYTPTKVDSKRLSDNQLLDNAIYLALEENGKADVLVKVNYFITKRSSLFTRRVKSISVSGYPARYVDFRQPTETDYENFVRLPQDPKNDILGKKPFFGKLFNKKRKRNDID